VYHRLGQKSLEPGPVDEINDIQWKRREEKRGEKRKGEEADRRQQKKKLFLTLQIMRGEGERKKGIGERGESLFRERKGEEKEVSHSVFTILSPSKKGEKKRGRKKKKGGRSESLLHYTSLPAG